MDEKITVTAEFSQTDVAAALMCLGEELTPERWEQVKAAPSKIDFQKIYCTLRGFSRDIELPRHLVGAFFLYRMCDTSLFHADVMRL